MRHRFTNEEMRRRSSELNPGAVPVGDAAGLVSDGEDHTPPQGARQDLEDKPEGVKVTSTSAGTLEGLKGPAEAVTH